MKVAVYNRHWATGGGGEKFAAGIAAALAGDHEVSLIAHEHLDTHWLGERLQLDLTGLRVELQPEDAGAVSRASKGYDLFVNASYRSGDPCQARHGLYVVHFPGPAPGHVERAQDRLAARLSPLLDAGLVVSLGDGFYLPERARMHTLHWTSGEATIAVQAPEGGTVKVVVQLGRFIPPQVGPVEVTAEVDGRVLAAVTLTAPRGRADRRRVVPLAFEVRVAPRTARIVTLRSLSWVPHEHGVGTDPRRLGVPVIGVHAGGGWRAAVARAVPTLVGVRDQLDFLDGYDRILSNSMYTQGWVKRLWGRDSAVFWPPVTLMRRSDKDPIILSVGRFFLPGTGHNKKQLELVTAFRRLYERNRSGWELHMAGGCSPEHAAYLDRIREAAEGLPVALHPDASGAALRQLYGRASIFWHAAGLGEDLERHPDRFEHFGITTVEAMSAGAVPVVIDAAGQVEIVEQGISGYRFATLEGLVGHTQHLIDDPDWREQMSRTAEQRAVGFGWDAFVTRTREVVAALVS